MRWRWGATQRRGGAAHGGEVLVGKVLCHLVACHRRIEFIVRHLVSVENTTPRSCAVNKKKSTKGGVINT